MEKYRHRGRPAAARPVQTKPSFVPESPKGKGFPLDQFEQYIDETILKRGLGYFKKGQVLEVEESSPGAYEGLVQGTETYTVNLSIQHGSVTECRCDCPYDLGPVCKHAAAVIFHLQREALGMESPEPQPGRKATKPPVKRLTKAEQVEETLQRISHEDLKDFVRKQAEGDRGLRNVFLATFIPPDTRESKARYAKQLRAIVGQLADRDGYIDHPQARQVGEAADRFLDLATRNLNEGQYRNALFIATAVLEEMIRAQDHADDSTSDIEEVKHAAFMTLSHLAEQSLPDPVRTSLLDYCIKAHDKRLFQDNDMDLDMLSVAAMLIRTDEEETRLAQALDKPYRQASRHTQAQLIHFSMVLHRRGDEAADAFLLENIGNDGLRAEAIRRFMNRQDYDQAIALAKQALEKSPRGKFDAPGRWHEWLLKIALERQDKAAIIEYTRLFYLDSYWHEEEKYDLLKRTVEPELWPAFVEDLITDAKRLRAHGFAEKLAGIHVAEAQWDRLMAVVRTFPDLERLAEYAPHLMPKYQDELVGFFIKAILEHLQYHTSRKDYQYVCKYMRKLRKMGAGDEVDALVDRLRQQYKSRPALMEELDKV